MIVNKVVSVQHSHIEGWLEFQLEVSWTDEPVVWNTIPFTYSPDDNSPISELLRERVIPILKGEKILPKPETSQET